jgi:hypothetical protein
VIQDRHVRHALLVDHRVHHAGEIDMPDEPELKAQSVFDAFGLLNKELIQKVLMIAKAVNIQQLDNGVIRVSVDLAPKDVE